MHLVALSNPDGYPREQVLGQHQELRQHQEEVAEAAEVEAHTVHETRTGVEEEEEEKEEA